MRFTKDMDLNLSHKIKTSNNCHYEIYHYTMLVIIHYFITLKFVFDLILYRLHFFIGMKTKDILISKLSKFYYRTTKLTSNLLNFNLLMIYFDLSKTIRETCLISDSQEGLLSGEPYFVDRNENKQRLIKQCLVIQSHRGQDTNKIGLILRIAQLQIDSINGSPE